MKHFVLISALFLLFTAHSAAQRNTDLPWTVGTAIALPESQIELSVFQPFRYNVKRYFEIYTHPLEWLAITPNLGVKKQWTKNDIFIGSKHGIYYPSLLLNTLSKTGLRYPPFYSPNPRDTIISANSQVPQIFVFTNEILASTWLQKGDCLAPNYLLTLKIGAHIPLVSGETNTLDTIKYPYFYHRTSTFHKKLFWYVGLDLDAMIHRRLHVAADVQLNSVGALSQWAVEHKGLVILNREREKANMRFVFGYQISFATTYPGGSRRFFISPLIDVMWTFKRKGKPTPGDLQ